MQRSGLSPVGRVSPVGMRCAAVLIGLAIAPSVRAETLFGSAPLRGTQSGTTFDVPETSSTSTLACPGRAGLYAGDKGLRVWVLRQGTMSERNPLRPLSRESLLVLEVVANGRLATAYGPDPANLTGAGSAPELERANGAIRWSPPSDQLPDAVRIIASDGSVLIGPLPFRECGDAPKAAPARIARPAPPSSGGGGGGKVVPAMALPQGAISER